MHMLSCYQTSCEVTTCGPSRKLKIDKCIYQIWSQSGYWLGKVLIYILENLIEVPLEKQLKS